MFLSCMLVNVTLIDFECHPSSDSRQINLIIFFGSISLSIYFCRPLTKQRRESNPGRLGGKRERFLCAMPSPQPQLNFT